MYANLDNLPNNLKKVMIVNNNESTYGGPYDPDPTTEQLDTRQLPIDEAIDENDLNQAEQRQVLIMRTAMRQAMADFAATPVPEQARGDVYQDGFHWLKLVKSLAVPVAIGVFNILTYTAAGVYGVTQALPVINDTIVFWITVLVICVVGVCGVIAYREYFRWKYTEFIADRISTKIVTPSSRWLWLVGDTQAARTDKIDNFKRKQNLLELMLKLNSSSITADTASTEDQFLKQIQYVKNADVLEKILNPLTSMSR